VILEDWKKKKKTVNEFDHLLQLIFRAGWDIYDLNLEGKLGQ